jgi:hypothetical protein
MRYYSSTAGEKTLSSAVNTSDTSVTLDSLSGLPASYPYTLVLDPDTASEEIVLVTGLSSGTTLNVTRGTDTYQGVTGGNGTAKQNHNSGAKVKHMITARDLQEPQDHIAASQDVHGLTGGAAVVGTTSSQTLSNKTISSSNNTISISSSAISDWTTQFNTKANINSPTFTGTVVLPSATSIGSVDSTELGYLNGVTSAVQTQLDAKQASDSDLTAIAGLSTTGIVVRTGAGTAATRTLIAGTNITLTNANGVSGDITIAATGGTGDVTTTTTQTISGAKTFSGTTTFTGNISANSLTISPTELGYLDGVTSNIQTQLSARPSFALRSGTDSLSVGSTASANETITFASAITKIAKPVVSLTVVEPTDISKGFRLMGEMVGSSSNWTGIKITAYNPSTSATVYYDYVVIGE